MEDLIIKYLPEVENYSGKKGNNLGLYVDNETTGLSSSDEIIETCVLPFTFDDDLNICKISRTPFTSFIQPKNKKITEETIKVTGITEDMVKNQTINLPKLKSYFEKSEIVISHKASFDRYYMEKDFGIQNVVWGCSKHDVNWREKGVQDSTLEFLCFKHGFYYNSHRAEEDCYAGIHLLSHSYEDKTHFKELIENAFKPEITIKLHNTQFEQKELIKSFGFFWGGKEKNWHTTIKEDPKDLLDKLNKANVKYKAEIVTGDINMRYKL